MMLTKLASHAKVGCLLMLVLKLISGCSGAGPAELATDWTYNNCDVPALVEDAIDEAVDHIHDRGFHIVDYDDGVVSGCDDSYAKTNAFLHTVRLCDDFYDLPEPAQAATLWHELAHIDTIQGEGAASYLNAASDDDMRWAYEVIGHRQNIIVYDALNWTAEADEIGLGVEWRIEALGAFAPDRADESRDLMSSVVEMIPVMCVR